MTDQNRILWLLRIYGPCSVAAMLGKSGLSRQQFVSGLTRLRALGLAERTMWATYRLTEAGQHAIRSENTDTVQVKFRWTER